MLVRTAPPSAVIAATLASDEVAAADGAGALLYGELQRCVDAGDDEGLVVLDVVLRVVGRADEWLQEHLEETLRAGLRLRETHQAASILVAGGDLQRILSGIPVLLREHAVRVDAAMRGLPGKG